MVLRSLQPPSHEITVHFNCGEEQVVEHVEMNGLSRVQSGIREERVSTLLDHPESRKAISDGVRY